MTRMQLILIQMPKPAPCARCAQTQADVLAERHLSEITFHASGPDGDDQPAGHNTAPCCDPESEQPEPCCPLCQSECLQYGYHFATYRGDLEGELARCRTCGWTGEIEETQPLLQPKPMQRALTSVAGHPAAA
jgi:hypothetical protein